MTKNSQICLLARCNWSLCVFVRSQVKVHLILWSELHEGWSMRARTAVKKNQLGICGTEPLHIMRPEATYINVSMMMQFAA